MLELTRKFSSKNNLGTTLILRTQSPLLEICTWHSQSETSPNFQNTWCRCGPQLLCLSLRQNIFYSAHCSTQISKFWTYSMISITQLIILRWEFEDELFPTLLVLGLVFNVHWTTQYTSPLRCPPTSTVSTLQPLHIHCNSSYF